MALVRLAQADAGVTRQLRKGDVVELRLPEVPASGYRWRWRLPEGVRAVADEFTSGQEGPPGEGSSGAGPPGAGGVRRLALDIVGAGRLLLGAELVRPWRAEPRRTLTFVLSVTDDTAPFE